MSAGPALSPGLTLAVADDAFAGALVVIVFPKTTAKSYGAMLAIAGRALRHVELDDLGKHFHCVAFARTGAAALDAIALLDLTRTLSGLQLYANGQWQRNAYRLAQVLECYANAERCTDPRAWCQVVTRAPVARPRPSGPLSATISVRVSPDDHSLWLFPCRYLLERGFAVEPLHPSSTEAQIEAGAIREGCAWCPRFSAASVIEP